MPYSQFSTLGKALKAFDLWVGEQWNAMAISEVGRPGGDNRFNGLPASTRRSNPGFFGLDGSQRIGLESQHLCHSAHNQRLCRDGRNLLVRSLCARKLIPEPTDTAYYQAIKEVLGF